MAETRLGARMATVTISHLNINRLYIRLLHIRHLHIRHLHISMRLNGLRHPLHPRLPRLYDHWHRIQIEGTRVPLHSTSHKDPRHSTKHE